MVAWISYGFEARPALEHYKTDTDTDTHMHTNTQTQTPTHKHEHIVRDVVERVRLQTRICNTVAA